MIFDILTGLIITTSSFVVGALLIVGFYKAFMFCERYCW
jgi:hypothetical protein